MNINEYLLRIDQLVPSSPIVSSYSITIDRKTEDIAYIAGTIEFRDGSMLDFKEFIEHKGDKIEKYMYGYNYRVKSAVMFRYDNTPDPRARGLKTFPHHKHLRDGKFIDAMEASMDTVLKEIEEIYEHGIS